MAGTTKRKKREGFVTLTTRVKHTMLLKLRNELAPRYGGTLTAMYEAVLINFFRGIGVPKEEFEKRVYEWNEKNEVPLRKAYINAQLNWSYNHKIIPPPNFDKDYYRGIGVDPTDEELKMKNPINFVIRKNTLENKK